MIWARNEVKIKMLFWHFKNNFDYQKSFNMYSFDSFLDINIARFKKKKTA